MDGNDFLSARHAFEFRLLSLAISPIEGRHCAIDGRTRTEGRRPGVIFHPGQRRRRCRRLLGAPLLFLSPLARPRPPAPGAAGRVINLSISRNDFVNPEILLPSPSPPLLSLSLSLSLRSFRHFTTAPSSLLTTIRSAATKVESSDGRRDDCSGPL